jgi:methylmalonyl-CoA/ethylmalonyl-CoA epimerase
MHENWKFHHISVVVKDMNKAIRHFESIGIGPFPPLIGPAGPVPLTNKRIGNKKSDYELDLRHARGGVGGLQFEVVQPLKGKTPVAEFLEKKGEGIHHIGFFVDDFDREAAKMKDRGFKITQYGETPTVKWAYFDTDKMGGVGIELMQETKKPKAEAKPEPKPASKPKAKPKAQKKKQAKKKR